MKNILLAQGKKILKTSFSSSFLFLSSYILFKENGKNTKVQGIFSQSIKYNLNYVYDIRFKNIVLL